MATRNLPRPFQFISPFFEEEDSWFPTMTFSQERGLSVWEDNNSVTVEAALPGLNSDDVDVSYHKGILRIKGESEQEEHDEKKTYYRKAMTNYSYSVAIPGKIDEAKEPEATFEKGVMKVTFAKSEIEQPKKIQIK